MLSLRRPSPQALQAFLEQHRDAPCSCRRLDVAGEIRPVGYVRDHQRTELGRGPETFQSACQALREWRMFDLGWASVADSVCPLVAGRVVGVLARVAFFWTLNACRILDVIDEPGNRFGFVYGTLDEHVEEGEERFLVERDSADRVWFDLLAVSRPHRWYVRMLSPLARLLQWRFRRDAALAMLRATQPRTN
jgi:uncharacterized protein (UPF0548 family)